MAIICSTNNCLLLCSLKWNLNIFNTSHSALNDECMLMRFFDIRTPFLMDGEAEKIAKEMEGNYELGDVDSQPRKKRKKNKLIEEIIIEENKTLTYICECYNNLNELDECKKFFEFRPSILDIRSNNRTVREVRDRFFTSSLLEFPPFNLFNSLSESTFHAIDERKFCIPAKSEYICGDINEFNSLLQNRLFDIVVIDPPWYNGHVRRRKKAQGVQHSYRSLSINDLFKFDLSKHLKENSLVFIWITNKESIQSIFKERLHEWNLEFVTSWYWLKVTKSGSYANPLKATSGHGKLPYECIWVTRKINSSEETSKKIAEDLVLCSVPCALHSSKPALRDVLRHYDLINNDSSCLEVFARSLIPCWTSIGNEVLKLQDTILLTE